MPVDLFKFPAAFGRFMTYVFGRSYLRCRLYSRLSLRDAYGCRSATEVNEAPAGLIWGCHAGLSLAKISRAGCSHVHGSDAFADEPHIRSRLAPVFKEGVAQLMKGIAMGNGIPPKTVLIADDSLLMRRMIGEILSSSGWEIVAEAATGNQAVEAYFHFRPTVVTMDIVMPEMDGLLALQRIIERDPEARIIVVSALSQTRLISEAIRKGAFDFVAKPFLPEQLRETVDRCYEVALACC